MGVREPANEGSVHAKVEHLVITALEESTFIFRSHPRTMPTALVKPTSAS